MKTAWAWLTRTQWVLWVILVGVVAAMALVFRRLVAGSRAPLSVPLVPEALRRKVEAAEEKALVARVEATVTAEGQRAQLETIMALPAADDGGAERRRRLAEMLSTLR